MPHKPTSTPIETLNSLAGELLNYLANQKKFQQNTNTNQDTVSMNIDKQDEERQYQSSRKTNALTKME